MKVVNVFSLQSDAPEPFREFVLKLVSEDVAFHDSFRIWLFNEIRRQLDLEADQCRVVGQERGQVHLGQFRGQLESDGTKVGHCAQGSGLEKSGWVKDGTAWLVLMTPFPNLTRARRRLSNASPLLPPPQCPGKG